MPEKLYGLLMKYPDQLKIIEEFCFPVCRRLTIGGIYSTLTGPMFPCAVPAAECPAFDLEMDRPIGDVDDVPVMIRKLRMPPAAKKIT